MILRFSLDTWSDIDYKTELQKQKFNSPGLSKYCQKGKKMESRSCLRYSFSIMYL